MPTTNKKATNPLLKKTKQELIDLLKTTEEQVVLRADLQITYEEALQNIRDIIQDQTSVIWDFINKYGHTPGLFNIWKVLFNKTYREDLREAMLVKASLDSLISWIDDLLPTTEATPNTDVEPTKQD